MQSKLLAAIVAAAITSMAVPSLHAGTCGHAMVAIPSGSNTIWISDLRCGDLSEWRSRMSADLMFAGLDVGVDILEHLNLAKSKAERRGDPDILMTVAAVAGFNVDPSTFHLTESAAKVTFADVPRGGCVATLSGAGDKLSTIVHFAGDHRNQQVKGILGSAKGCSELVFIRDVGAGWTAPFDQPTPSFKPVSSGKVRTSEGFGSVGTVLSDAFGVGDLAAGDICAHEELRSVRVLLEREIITDTVARTWGIDSGLALELMDPDFSEGWEEIPTETESYVCELVWIAQLNDPEEPFTGSDEDEQNADYDLELFEMTPDELWNLYQSGLD